MSNRNKFFDPYNKEHVAMYQYFVKNGCWPESLNIDPMSAAFLPSDAASKMAFAWVKQELKN